MRSCFFILSIFCFFSSYSQNTRSVIENYLNDNHRQHQLLPGDTDEFKINKQFDSKSLDGKHVYIQQTIQGIPVFNAVSSLLIKKQKVKVFNSSFVRDIENKADQLVNTSSESIDVKAAFENIISDLGITIDGQITIKEVENDGTIHLTNSGISNREIKAKLIYQPVNDREELRLAWDINFKPLNDNNWWSIAVDAQNGNLIRKHNRMQTCHFEQPEFDGIQITESGKPLMFSESDSNAMNESYRVYPTPIESPNHGSRSLIANPADPGASPFGWHDTDGATGAEYTITRGNNVLAREDRDGDDAGGYSPDGGAALQFDFSLDFNQPPQLNEDAAITNLFYWNNIMHDVFANYGFDEASGNFQETNYSSNGSGGDFVIAEAQDGSGTNNANFGTPPEGSNPQMQMFLWSPPGGPNDNFVVNSPQSLADSFLGIPAGFGPFIPANPITTDLVLIQDDNSTIFTNPHDACDTITNPNELNGSIAVIERGTCTFVSKIQKAQNAGALAVIMVNNEAGNAITMGGDDDSITIPSVMITMQEGSPIINSLQNGNNLNATLVNNGPFRVDGDYDNGIVAHEYGHGISTRLTGGSDQADCLFNDEQMGEGWSDWIGLVTTMETGDQPQDPRGYATFALSQDVTGSGIRPARYTTDMNINPATYSITNNENSISQPHGIGFVWASMLWDLTWAFVDEYGFDANLLNGIGGNNMAMQLILDGMKLQSCNPGFIDGRDAILQADQLLNNGTNSCMIWETFARRGLGFSADQGSPLSRTDQTEAFDLPPQCTLSVNNIDSSSFAVYPNPASQTVNIKFSNLLDTPGKVSVYSLNGKQMLQQDLETVDQAQINVDKLSSGVYILKLEVENRSLTKKLIIQ